MGFGYVSNTGIGRSLYVVGNHADLGNWDPAHAVRLYYTAGNVWTGRVGIQSGTALEYKFISRDDGSGQHCETTNVQWMAGANLSNNVAAQPGAPYAGKTILYHSVWTNASILYKVGTNFVDAAMSRVGNGRNVTEFLYRVAGIGEAGEGIEFVPHGFTVGGVEQYDNAPYPGYGANNYFTPLDVFFLQDKNVYNYWPPATVSVSRIVSTNVGSSWAPTIPSRNIRIYLPRGYDQNSWRRYPVLYMHDGQNVFDPGGGFGSWGAEHTADREISQGRMRETIIVGVDNTSERLREYIPPGDNAGFGAGTGDQYANFLVHNVRPTLDFNFRTTNDPANTLALGSSLGGLISAYLGLETNVYGKVGPMSPSFWAASNFVGRIDSNATLGLRIYLDWGTAESDEDMWNPGWSTYGLFLQDGYAVNKDILQVVGCGHAHNEAAWSNRLTGAFQFLLNPADEPNLLAQNQYPPTATGVTAVTTFGLTMASMGGWTYVLERSTTLTGGVWRGVSTSSVETLPWSNISLFDTNSLAFSTGAVYRIIAR